MSKTPNFSVEVLLYDQLTDEFWNAWESWKDTYAQQSATVFQEKAWSQWMATFLGKSAVSFLKILGPDGRLCAGTLAIHYPLYKHYYWVYYPRGPLCAEDFLHLYPNVFSSIAKEHVARLPDGCVWVRMDPIASQLTAHDFFGLVHAHKSFHPKRTLLLDLTLSPEKLLEQMTQKGRYNIRLTQKKGIEVIPLQWDVQKQSWNVLVMPNIDPEYPSFITKIPPILEGDPIQIYAQIASETANRDGFSAHNYSYFDAFVKGLSPRSFVVFAYDREEQKVLAAGIFVCGKQECYYYYGASTTFLREKMAPYAVQWAGILLAKEHFGSRWYDFLGIGDDKPTDPLAGVTAFKKKFGGLVREDVGTYEYVHNYWLYRAVLLIKWLKSFGHR